MRSNASFDLKLDRAAEHLEELRASIDSYAESCPYEFVLVKTKPAGSVYQLRFTRPIDPWVAVVVGDVVHNLHSALDHMAAALVAPKHRRAVYFPIFFQGVWDPPVSGDDDDRRKQRVDWTKVTRLMNPAAVAIIRECQPLDEKPEGMLAEHALTVLHRVWNADKHSRLAIVSGTLRFPELVYRFEGQDETLVLSSTTRVAATHGATVTLAPGAVVERFTGTPIAMLQLGKDDEGGYELPGGLEYTLKEARAMFDRLRPHLFGSERWQRT